MMDLYRSHSQERKKTCLQGGGGGVEPVPDRLSELPDSLILHILSFLEMKDVVKTGILSKRWQLLWTQVNTIVYRGISTHQKQSRGSYISFIHTTLLKCVSNIKQFSLHSMFWYRDMYRNDKSVFSKIDKWIAYVCHKNVEVMELVLYDLVYTIPDSLYRSLSLKNLNLGGVRMHLSSPVDWALLRSLILNRVSVDNASMNNVLLGCPLLENLVLMEVTGLNYLNIMSPSVKRLTIEYQERVYDKDRKTNIVYDLLEIRVPWLQELEISHNILVRNFRVLDASSLVKATLTCLPCDNCMHVEEEYQRECIRMATILIKALCHVGELIIGSLFIQVLLSSKLTGISYPSFKCTRLTINSPVLHHEIPGLAYLLQNAPHLETLIIMVSSQKYDIRLSPVEELFADDEPHLDQAHINLEHLKTVIVDYHGLCYDHPKAKCCDVDLVSYILMRATTLESLVLYSSVPDCNWTHCHYPKCTFRYVPRLASSLTNFLAGNETVDWELKKRKFTFEFKFSDYASIRSANWG